MQLFFAVLGLAAVATAGVVVEHPVEHLSEQSAVQPSVKLTEKSTVQPSVKLAEKSTVQPSVKLAEKTATPLEAPRVELESGAKMISLYSDPNVPESRRAHEMGGVRKVLNGPVMVAFKDGVEDKMNVFLLPYGFKFLNVYDPEEVRPLVQYLNNGRQKSFMYLSAGSHLQVPEMLKKLDQIHLPAYNLNTAVRIAENSSPYPYVLIVDTDSIKGNTRIADLKELGVFKMEKGVLAVVRDNYPNDRDLEVDNVQSRSFGIVLPVHSEEDAIREYLKSVFADKDLVQDYVKPVYTVKDLVRDYVKPVYTGKDFVREYVKPVYTEEDLVSQYAKPVYAKIVPTHEYVKAIFADKDLVGEYEKPVYTEKDLINEYAKRFYNEKDLAREYLRSVYAADAEKDLIRGYYSPIYSDRDLVREYF